jgi:hypothetical protein
MSGQREGKYMYCIIQSGTPKSFGPIGIGDRGDEVTTVTHRDLGAVVSASPIQEYRVSRQNTMAHEELIEWVMKDHDVLPIRFSTIAETEEEIIEKVLKPRYQEFQDLFLWIHDKKELGLKIYWQDMKAILNEIVEENETIKSFREEIQGKPPQQTYYDQIEIGKRIEAELEGKRERERDSLIESLKNLSEDYKVHETYLPELVLSAAFLVKKEKESEFEETLNQIERDTPGRYKVNYVVDAPPVNFVNIVIQWNREEVKNVSSG